MGTPSSHLHYSGRDVLGHVTSSRQGQIAHHVSVVEETKHFFTRNQKDKSEFICVASFSENLGLCVHTIHW